MVHNDIVQIQGKLCIYLFKYYPKVIIFIAVSFYSYVFYCYERTYCWQLIGLYCL